MPTDSKTTLKNFKNQTKKLPLKIQKPEISLKSQNIRKLTPPPNMPILNTNVGPSQVAIGHQLSAGARRRAM